MEKRSDASTRVLGLISVAGIDCKYPLNLGSSVLADEPAPLRQGPIVDELDDDGLFVFDRFKLLKSVRPKKRPKAIRQAACLGRWIEEFVGISLVFYTVTV